MDAPLTDRVYAGFQTLLYERAGIRLSRDKKPLLCGRLARRLKERGVGGYDEYLSLITDRDPMELQAAIDLLTTNETYFFREPKLFAFLEKLADLAAGRGLRIWSAACSSGEEPYSIAMVLADKLGRAPWEVFGSDL